MVVEIAGRILPVFGVVAAGALVGRLRPLPERATRALADYLVLIGAPLLTAVSVARAPIAGRAAAGLAAVAAATVVANALLAAGAARLAGREARRLVLPAMLMNCGNLGYPVNRLVFGETGGHGAILFWVTVSLLAFTLGVALVAPRAPVATALRLPLVWAAIGGLAARSAGLAPPAWAESAAAWAVLPLLLLLLGHDVGGMRGAAWREGLAIAAIRVGGGAAVGALLAPLLLPPGTLRAVAAVEAAMPSAVMAFLLARKYGAAPEAAAAAVILSTAAAPLYLPVWISLRAP